MTKLASCLKQFRGSIDASDKSDIRMLRKSGFTAEYSVAQVLEVAKTDYSAVIDSIRAAGGRVKMRDGTYLEATTTASQDVTLDPAAQEQTDELQSPIRPRDEGEGTQDVHAAPQDGSAGQAPAGQVEGGAPDVQGANQDRTETDQRPAGDAAPHTGGTASDGNVDRVPPGRDRNRAAADAVKGENYVILPGALAEDRGRVQKARDNIQAIKLLREIEAEARPATKAEQAELARYVGWGGLKGAFPDAQGNFERSLAGIGQDLKDLLSEEEYNTARRSLQYAHFTAETVVRAMWDALETFGFAGGKVFEPGMGVGNFAGLMDTDVAHNTDYSGLELDHTTARIARLLYPQWGIRQDDFTKAPVPKDTFDVVIGNPPFADVAIKSDAAYPQGFLLHDYFFAKSMDSLRPGGVLAFISSAGTMNKLDTKAREYLADRAELLGAIRLPGDAFKKNAGTEVTTDIIFLRKRLEAEEPGDRTWTETVPVTLPNKEGTMTDGRMSRYFHENPDMVLGEQGFFDKLYPGRYGVRARPDAELSTQLAEAIEKLEDYKMTDWTTSRAEIDFATSEQKEGSYYFKGAELLQLTNGVGTPVQRRGKGVTGGKTLAEIERIKGLIPIRDALRAVYAADMAEDAPNAKAARKRLNEAYDLFHKRFGPINQAKLTYSRPSVIQQEVARRKAKEDARYVGSEFSEGTFDSATLADEDGFLPSNTVLAKARQEARDRHSDLFNAFDEGTFDHRDMPDNVKDKRPNVDGFMLDPESYRLRAIERYDDETGENSKGDVFNKNIIAREKKPKISSINDAVLYVLNVNGRFDVDKVAELYGVTTQDAIKQLGDKIYRDPEGLNNWLLGEEYLSGNVVKKLAIARAAADNDPSLRRNVDALEANQPTPVPPSKIQASLGMPWIPIEIVDQFARQHMGFEDVDIRYIPTLAEWIVTGNENQAAATSVWGTPERSGIKLLGDALSRKNPVIRHPPGPNETVGAMNVVATDAANDKIKEMREAFGGRPNSSGGWVWEEQERAEWLADLYNEKNNNIKDRPYNGDYLTTPGVNTDWQWRPHQSGVIARIIQSGNTYMAHAVGSGKTSAMVGAGMEMRRLGLVRKPMYAVPNHMLAQFSKEFYEQYPLAQIMVADETAFHTSRRKAFIAKVANSDLDAVIITHSSFKSIPVSAGFQDNLIQKELDEYREVLASIDNADPDTRITRGRIESQIESMEQRLVGQATGRKDAQYTFEEMGIDFLFVDEAHEFRKLDFSTQMSTVKGVNPKGSGMSWDLFVKTRYLETVNPGRSLVLASGTPITNTMAELFTVSRYIQPEALEERGLSRFDAWAGSYGDTKTETEQNAAGNYESVTRFGQFVNAAELSLMVRQNMDIVTSKQLDEYVTRPKIAGGERVMHIAEQDETLVRYQASLDARLTAIRNRRGRPSPGDDIILSVIGDGRHAAIDMRFVNNALPNNPSNKLNLLTQNVYDIWERTKDIPFYETLGEDERGYQNKAAFRGPGTQLVFSNLGVSGKRGFATGPYIRAELVKRGVPRNEIALIGDYKTHVQKQRLFNDVNEGKVRIVIGSTGKMATGVNMQRRLGAIHNLDPLWYPAEDEQRNGRGIRQGNMNREIEIHDYSTKGTYDSSMWKLMAKKQRFIQDFFEGDSTMRVMEDLGEASQYEQAAALTTSDPRQIVLAEMIQKLEKLDRKKQAFDQDHYANKTKIERAEESVAHYERLVPLTEKDISKTVSTKGDAFSGLVDDVTYAGEGSRFDFGEALRAVAADLLERKINTKNKVIGTLGGHPVVILVRPKKTLDPVYFGIKFGAGRIQFTQMSESEVGNARSLEMIVQALPDTLEYYKERIATARGQIRDYTPLMGKKFEGQAEINKLATEVNELQDSLLEATPAAAAPNQDVTEEGLAEFERDQLDPTAWEDDGGFTEGKLSLRRDGQGFTQERLKALDVELMAAVRGTDAPGAALSAATEKLKMAKQVRDSSPGEVLKLELDIRRRIKELTESSKTNPTSVEPLRQAKLLLESTKNPDIAALTKEAEQARLVYDEAHDKMRRANSIRNRFATAEGKLSLAQPEQPWYFSPITRAAEGLKQKKGQPKQMLAMLKKVPGVKAEEIALTGIEEYLATFEGKPITKEQIVSFLKAGGVQLKEVTLTEGANAEAAQDSLINEVLEGTDFILDPEDRTGFINTRLGIPIELDNMPAAIQHNLEGVLLDPEFSSITAKFKKWTLEREYSMGNVTNYREKLLIVPPLEPEILYSGQIAFADVDANAIDDALVDISAAGLEQWGYGRMTLEAADGSGEYDALTYTDLPGSIYQQFQEIARDNGGVMVGEKRRKNVPTWEEMRDKSVATWADLNGHEGRTFEELSTENQATFESVFGDAMDYRRRQKHKKFGQDVWRDTHWDQVNVVVHFRLADHEGQNGEKVLVVEEKQSGVHQAGKKRGYTNDFEDLTPDDLIVTPKHDEIDGIEELGERGMELARFYEVSIKKDDGKGGFKPGLFVTTVQRHIMFPGGPTTLEKVAAAPPPSVESIKMEALDRVLNRPNETAAPRAVANLPFKGNAWVELAIKRIIREAAEGGYDQIAWPTGDQQADRYDLSKQLQSIEYQKNGNANSTGSTYRVRATALNGGNVFNRQAVKDEELEGLVGKEIAQGIIDGTAGEKDTNEVVAYRGGPWRVITGEGLKVGGEGMRGFYDKTAPNLYRKVAKKLDKAAKVGSTKLLTNKTYQPMKVMQSDAITSDVRSPDGKEWFVVDKNGQWGSTPYATKAAATDTLGKWGIAIDYAGDTSNVHAFRLESMHGVYDSRADAQARLDKMLAEQITGGIDVWAMDVTEQMKEQALLGLPLFTLKSGVAAQADRIETDLKARLKKVGIDDRVAVKLVDVIRSVGDGGALSGAQGRYLSRVIEVAADAKDKAWVMDHEVIHALKELGVIRSAEWKVLERAAKSRMTETEHLYSGRNLTQAELREEAIADMHADYTTGKLAAKGFMKTAFDRISNFLRALGNALAGRGFNSANDIFDRIDRGEMGTRQEEGTPPPAQASPVSSPDIRESRGGPLSVKKPLGKFDAKKGKAALVEFDNPETEARWKEARKGAGSGATLWARFKETKNRIGAGFTRHYLPLPNKPEFSEAKEQLRKIEAAPQAAKEEALRVLKTIVKGMSQEELDLFTRKVVLDDLTFEKEEGHEVAFGLETAEDVARELAKVDAALTPELRERVMIRRAMVNSVADDMVRSGVLTSARIKNPAYYRHQVLEYARAQVEVANTPGKKLRAPHWARRMGSKMDINANLLEAEFEWLQIALTNIAVNDVINWFKASEYNQHDSVVASAKAHNDKLVNKLLQTDMRLNGYTTPTGRETSPLNEEAMRFRQRIAIGLGRVKAATGQLVDVPPYFQQLVEDLQFDIEPETSIFPFLTWLIDEDQPGAEGAAMAFKAMNQRKAWKRTLLGDNYADPMNLESLIKKGFAPDNHATWQPEEGKVLYTAKTLPEHVIQRLQERIAEDNAGYITAEELQGALESVKTVNAVGGPKYQLVLPNELVATFQTINDEHSDTIIEVMFAGPNRAWKRWVLINPRRVLKYNINNLSGDLDAVITGNPRAVLKLPQAIAELWRVMIKQKTPTQTYRDAVTRGVFDSGLTIQEIPDINYLAEFETLLDRPAVWKRPDKAVGRAAMKIWRALQRYTWFRENWLRYAAYLDYVERIEKGESQKSIGYGAAVPEMVDALSDPKDKAALLARQLVGDYGNISHYGKGLRKYLMPFYSWMEINTKRYVQFGLNGWEQGIGQGFKASGIIGASIGVRTTAYLYLRMIALYGSIYLWNNLVFGDEEDELSTEEKVRLHLILGRDKDGRVRTMRFQGALSDFLMWIGFDDAVGVMVEVEKGRASVLDVIAAIAKAPVNKVISNITPLISAPVEYFSGKQYWPDVFHPRAIRDHSRKLAQLFSVEHEYDWIFKKPSRGYLGSLTQSLVYKRDPGENAYNQTRGLTFEWQRRVKGLIGTGGYTTPRSTALYEWKKAQRFGDEDAETAAYEKMRNMGMGGESLRRSIAKAHPLGAIALKDRASFKATLAGEELDRLDRAIDWYTETYK